LYWWRKCQAMIPRRLVFFHLIWRIPCISSTLPNCSVILQHVAKGSHSFRALNSLSPNGLYKSIPVPSRLYHPIPTPERPLSRLRLAISDAISVRGIETTLSSRAWTSLHGSGASITDKYVQDLVDLGAVIVGKTKDSPFGAGEEWVDASSPWNPRGDGYQDAAGSSAGVAVAIAAYDWLDYGIGRHSTSRMGLPSALSLTTCSIRNDARLGSAEWSLLHPAFACGLLCIGFTSLFSVSVA
jgi:hypothetical protein